MQCFPETVWAAKKLYFLLLKLVFRKIVYFSAVYSIGSTQHFAPSETQMLTLGKG